MTGTFDDWAKSVKLDKKGEVFERRVDLAKAEKTYYKVCVDLFADVLQLRSRSVQWSTPWQLSGVHCSSGLWSKTINLFMLDLSQYALHNLRDI